MQFKCIKCGYDAQQDLVSFYPFGTYCEPCFCGVFAILDRDWHVLERMVLRIKDKYGGKLPQK